MLVITIRPHSYVSIGDDIKIYNTQDEQIRVGIDAPRNIPVLREDAKVKVRQPNHGKS